MKNKLEYDFKELSKVEIPKGYLAITNNSFLEKNDNTLFINGSFLDVLLKTRDYIHKGYELITSPLGASIRIMYSPVRTIVVKQSSMFDENHITLIEQSVEKYKITMGSRNVDSKNTEDYQFIDCELLSSAILEIKLIENKIKKEVE